MQPRRRPRKTGQKRGDAALDAMRFYGFPERLISKTLTELLNLYGEDGWTFIEEASYKVLLEAILEKVDKEDQDKTEECLDVGSEMVSSSTPLSSTNVTAIEEVTEAEQAAKAAVPAIETESASHSNETINSLAGSKTALEVTETNETSKKKEAANSGFSLCGNANRVVLNMNTNTPRSTQNSIPSPIPADIIVLTRRRKPCYGWISSDDDDYDDDDIVELTPEPFSEDLKRLLLLNGQRKRKSRWDVKSEDF